MRYSTQLHTHSAHHRNIWHSRISTIIGFVALASTLVGLVLLARGAHLDANMLYTGFVVSLIRVSIAYVFAVILAVIIAIVLTTNQYIEVVFLPILDVLQSFPSFALFPFLVSALQHQPEIVIIGVLIITMIWPILFTIVGSVKNRRQDLEEAATVFGAKGWRRFTGFTLPSLFPSIITGSIVGWGEGWEFIIGAELLVNTNIGIGHYLGVLGTSHQNSLLALGIVILMFLLFVINKTLWLPLLHQATKYESES